MPAEATTRLQQIKNPASGFLGFQKSGKDEQNTWTNGSLVKDGKCVKCVSLSFAHEK